MDDLVPLRELAPIVGRARSTVYNWVKWGLLHKNSDGLVSVSEAKKVRSYLKYERSYGPQKDRAPRFSRGGHAEVPKHFYNSFENTQLP